jgi:hypothetical protein
MEDLAVTRLWMAGVVAAMAVFGIIAMIGYYRQKNADDANKNTDVESSGS